MTVHWLDDSLRFPPPETATEDGVLAVGDDLRPERLVAAYSQGVFPWPIRGYPLLWFCPDPRFVLPLDNARLSRSVRKAVRRGAYRVTMDTAFSEVIDHCAHVPRPGQDGSWITPALRNGFVRLHQLGFAHSVEAWDRGGRLVGGLYGVSLGGTFFGESMFARNPDASKVAFVTLLAQLRRWGFTLVDCQVHTEHLARFGAREIPRVAFLEHLAQSLRAPTRRGAWHIDIERDAVLPTILAPASPCSTAGSDSA